MKTLLATLSIFCTSLVWAQQTPPKINVKQEGKMTNYEVEGNLAPTTQLPCIDLKQAKNTYTPPDLYIAVTQCVKDGHYDKALPLFILAGTYSRFDAERITDESAKQGRAVLVLNTFSAFSQPQERQFKEFAQSKMDDPSFKAALCQQIDKVGMPNYYPKYMILHGMSAFTGDPYQNALVSNFNAQATWQQVKKDYAMCAE